MNQLKKKNCFHKILTNGFNNPWILNKDGALILKKGGGGVKEGQSYQNEWREKRELF